MYLALKQDTHSHLLKLTFPPGTFKVVAKFEAEWYIGEEERSGEASLLFCVATINGPLTSDGSWHSLSTILELILCESGFLSKRCLDASSKCDISPDERLSYSNNSYRRYNTFFVGRILLHQCDIMSINITNWF